MVPNFIAGVIQFSFLQILVGGSGSSRRSHERCRETIIHLYLHKYKDDCFVVVFDEDDGGGDFGQRWKRTTRELVCLSKNFQYQNE